jgi:hypothetical protein
MVKTCVACRLPLPTVREVSGDAPDGSKVKFDLKGKKGYRWHLIGVVILICILSWSRWSYLRCREYARPRTQEVFLIAGHEVMRWSQGRHRKSVREDAPLPAPPPLSSI